MRTPEERAERWIDWRETRMGSRMRGSDWRGSMLYGSVALNFAVRDFTRALGWRRFLRWTSRVVERLGRAVAS